MGAYVGDLLKPRFKSNAITKEDYKWIVRKTVDKVYHVYVSLLACHQQVMGIVAVASLYGYAACRQCKAIMPAAVFQTFSPFLQVASSSTSTSGSDFLTDKRKAKIASVVEHYFSQRKQDQSATST